MTRISKKFFYITFFLILSLHIGHIYAYCCGGCCSATRCGDCGELQPICCNSTCYGYPFYLTRSQGRNAAREIVGTQEFIHQFDRCDSYGALSVSFEYQRTFWPEQISRYLFGDDYINCCNLYIQGSQVENRNKQAWLADYFGLAPDYESRVSFCPKIQNAIVDANLYVGLDNLADGLYLNINLPIAWTKWELNPYEIICSEHTKTFEAGYMSQEEISKEDMSKSFLAYMNGNTWGDMRSPVRYSRIKKGSCTKIMLAHFRASLGYDFVLDEDYHLGFFVQFVAPTGNRPSSKRLFEPMVGNGKHWEIGGGLTGSWIFHRSKCEADRYLGVWCDMTLAHLIHTNQFRSFDLLCKPNSRYMLLEEMGSNVDSIQGFDTITSTTTVSSYQYKKNLIPAVNLTTFNIDVRHDLQVDFAAKLGFVNKNWSIDFGYNFWALTGEKFQLDACECEPFENFSIKGDSFIYGKTDGGPIFPLSATQSLADIHSGKNYPKQSSDTIVPYQNPRVDNAKEALKDENILYSLFKDIPINTSVDPELVTRRELNLEDAPSAMTHKVFAHVSYASKEHETVVPFVGVGGQVEFAKNRCKSGCNSHDHCCHSSCCSCSSCSCSGCSCSSSCSCGNPSCGGCDNQKWECDHCCDQSCNKRAGSSQWGIWLKGGLSFD